MVQEFMNDFKHFAVERIERDGINPGLSVLQQKVDVVEESIISGLGATDDAEALMTEHIDLMSELINLRTEAAYKRGMQDAYLFMEMLKGSN